MLSTGRLLFDRFKMLYHFVHVPWGGGGAIWYPLRLRTLALPFHRRRNLVPRCPPPTNNLSLAVLPPLQL